MEEIGSQLTYLQATLSFNAQQALHAQSVNQTMEQELQQSMSGLQAAQKSNTKLQREMKKMVPKDKLAESEKARVETEQKLQEALEQVEALTKANTQLQQAYDTMSTEHGAIKAMYIHVVGSLEGSLDQHKLNPKEESLTPRYVYTDNIHIHILYTWVRVRLRVCRFQTALGRSRGSDWNTRLQSTRREH